MKVSVSVNAPIWTPAPSVILPEKHSPEVLDGSARWLRIIFCSHHYLGTSAKSGEASLLFVRYVLTAGTRCVQRASAQQEKLEEAVLPRFKSIY